MTWAVPASEDAWRLGFQLWVGISCHFYNTVWSLKDFEAPKWHWTTERQKGSESVRKGKFKKNTHNNSSDGQAWTDSHKRFADLLFLGFFSLCAGTAWAGTAQAESAGGNTVAAPVLWLGLGRCDAPVNLTKTSNGLAIWYNWQRCLSFLAFSWKVWIRVDVGPSNLLGVKT